MQPGEVERVCPAESVHGGEGVLGASSFADMRMLIPEKLAEKGWPRASLGKGGRRCHNRQSKDKERPLGRKRLANGRLI